MNIETCTVNTHSDDTRYVYVYHSLLFKENNKNMWYT